MKTYLQTYEVLVEPDFGYKLQGPSKNQLTRLAHREMDGVKSVEMLNYSVRFSMFPKDRTESQVQEIVHAFAARNMREVKE